MLTTTELRSLGRVPIAARLVLSEPRPEARDERAARLVARAGAVRRLADGRWWVESEARPGAGYRVAADLSGCECADWRGRGGRCKHMRAAEARGDLAVAS